MSHIRRKLKKLKGRSLGEIRVRSLQALAAFAERHGWSEQTRVPDDAILFRLMERNRIGTDIKSPDSLLNHFKHRKYPNFFAAFTSQEATLKGFNNRFSPSSKYQIVERANRIASGRFDLLGLTDLKFGDPIQWHLEPVSGKRAPFVHWSAIDELGLEATGDPKLIWELNRHQHFTTLGKAYWLTGDEHYAQIFIAHLQSWMDQNPPKVGINWTSSLEVAFRSISWLWALYFFRHSQLLNSAIFVRAIKFLYLHARHLETYLSTYFSPNTHLTGEALGLFYLGTLLPEFSESTRWRSLGRKILTTQLRSQIKPDGVYFEHASYYHRYTTDFYTHFLILSRENNETELDDVETKLISLLDHLMYITRPDGTTPFFGDDDGGRLGTFDGRPANDFRATLATSAVLFSRPDYKFVAREQAEETLWLLGPEGLREFDSLQAREPAARSVAFTHSGYYVMRDSWSRDANLFLFDSGAHGGLSFGHAHADALSFELVVKGRTLLVDPGTFTYTGSKKMRDWFRRSKAHNTLTIDDESSSVPDGPFSWSNVCNSESLSWVSRDRFDYVEGKEDGYERLPEPACHTRSVLFLKNDYWVIRDQVKTAAKHQVDLWFHFATTANPRIEIEAEYAAKLTEIGDYMNLDVVTIANQGNWRAEDGWVSNCYGKKEKARVYAFSKLIEGDEQFLTFLIPYLSGTKCRVRELEAIGGRAFEIVHHDVVDILAITGGRAGQNVEMERLTADFAWTWARFSSREESTPTQLVLLNGKRLELQGREIIKSNRQVDYLAACRVGDQFRVETGDGILNLSFPITDLESLFAGSKGEFYSRFSG